MVMTSQLMVLRDQKTWRKWEWYFRLDGRSVIFDEVIDLRWKQVHFSVFILFDPPEGKCLGTDC